MEKSTGVETHNWFGDIRFRPQVMVRPDTPEDIIAIVRDPASYPAPVRAFGSAHSVTGCIVSEPGTAIDMRGLNRILHIGADRVVVQAGALFLDVAQELEKHNLQFYVHIELGNIRLGSAASTHTKDASFAGEYGTFSSYAIGMKAVLPTGEILEVSEDQPDLLQAMRSSYGLLGIIFEVTFRVKPLRAFAFHQESFSIDEFEQQFPALLARRQSIMYYLFPFRNQVSVEFRDYVDAKPAHAFAWKIRNYCWAVLVPTIGAAIRLWVPGKWLRYALLELMGASTHALLRVLRARNAYPADQTIRYPPQPGFAKYTFSIWVFPREGFFDTLRAYCEFCREYHRTRGYRNDLVNVGYAIDQDQSSLFSYNYDGPVMTIDPACTGGEEWHAFVDACNTFCSAHGGCPLFNQSPRLTGAQVRRAYGSRIEAFSAFQRRYDPGNRFVNAYFADILGLSLADTTTPPSPAMAIH